MNLFCLCAQAANKVNLRRIQAIKKEIDGGISPSAVAREYAILEEYKILKEVMVEFLPQWRGSIMFLNALYIMLEKELKKYKFESRRKQCFKQTTKD